MLAASSTRARRSRDPADNGISDVRPNILRKDGVFVKPTFYLAHRGGIETTLEKPNPETSAVK